MKVFVYILIGLILTILESSTLSFLPIEFFKPDFGMPFIVYTAFFLGPQAGLITSILIGLIQEIMSNSPHGSMLFTKVSIFIMSTFLKNKLYIDSRYSFSYICGGFVLFESFLFLILSFLSKGETKNIVNMLFYTIPNAIFTGFVSIFIFSLIEFLNEKYLNREY
jgi:rod shape-determining protein MreD